MANILVVDDDRVLSHLIASLLRDKGHKVVAAFDAVQAMMLAMKPPHFDVVILDINMPGGSGEDTLRKLKMSTRTSAMPIIVLSGSIDEAGRKRVMEHGAAAALGKPLVPDELFAAIESVL
ncbi:MAG TPA: response regulator transcription factor [Gemmatimonadaceae bacterium]|nr:response regulator transcription factor [Gemmatimonadaceae bacterium]